MIAVKMAFVAFLLIHSPVAIHSFAEDKVSQAMNDVWTAECGVAEE